MDLNTVRECFLYEKETGRLVWRARPQRHFKTSAVRRAVNRRFALTEAGSVKSNGYHCKECGRAHRIIWLLVTGSWPVEIDHRNHIRADNRWCNLREVSGLENHQNMGQYANNSSGVPGVHWCKTYKKWVAKITQYKRRRTLGYFTDLDDAIAARKAAELENT